MKPRLKAFSSVPKKGMSTCVPESKKRARAISHLHVADLHSTPSIPYDPLNPSRNKSWVAIEHLWVWPQSKANKKKVSRRRLSELLPAQWQCCWQSCWSFLCRASQTWTPQSLLVPRRPWTKSGRWYPAQTASLSTPMATENPRA